jgi:hypothetical protein
MITEWALGDWIKTAFQNVLDALAALYDTLNPLTVIMKFLEMATALLPEPADLSAFYSGYESAMAFLAPSLQLMNMFVNLPVFGAGILICIAVETFINALRAWRIVRSLVT